jgi:hypothetical protein
MGGNLLHMRTLASSIAAARHKLAQAAGYTMGGARNLFAALGYKEQLEVADYYRRYKRNPIARRVVDALPKGTWKGLGELIEDEDPQKTTAFEDAWFALSDKHNIWAMMNRADRVAGLGRFSTLLIGAPGELDTELPQGGPDTLLYLAVHGDGDIDVKEKDFISEPTNERYGRPEYYTLKAKRTLGVQDKRIHWTRIIHIADSPLDNDLYGEPRLECVWNDLDNLEKLAGGGSEAFWLRAHQGYQFDLDPAIALDPAGEEKLKEEVDEFLQGMRRSLRTRGVKVTTLGSDTADFSSGVDAILKLISAGSTIPVRILVGSERGELASSQDRDNWNERINDRRSEFAEPFMIRPFIDRLIKYGYLPTPVEGYEVRWPVTDPSDGEKADLATKWAEVNNKAGETVVTPDEIRDRCLGLESLESIGFEEEEENVEVVLPEDEVEQELIAARRKLRDLARRRRVYGTALDKRRRWWKKKHGRQSVTAHR